MQPAFREQLVAWYAANARDLPWRKRPTPYRVWVSEIMLQQTRVETVRDYFTRFMKRFPSVKKLADAPEESVLEAWSGLGYYRRARMLHGAAKQIVENHRGRFPKDRASVLGLPGIGRYTAGAVLSIAFDQPEPIVDGNVERVFARLQCIKDDVKSASGNKRIWQSATEHVTLGRKEGLSPSELNQALMELGATICTPTNPSCDACPVNGHCKAFELDQVDRYPKLPTRTLSKKRKYLFAAVFDDHGRILMTRRPAKDRQSLLPGGMWELPHTECEQSKHQSIRDIAERLGTTLQTAGASRQRSHTIMNYRLTLVVQKCVADGAIRPDLDHRWLEPQQAENAAIASATRKLLQALS